MRIAFFSETFLPQTNGIVTRLCHTLTELHVQYADRLLVIAPQMPGLPPCYQAAPVIGVPSVALPCYRGFRCGLPWLNGQDSAMLVAFKPEVIHVVNPASGIAWLALQYAAQHHVPLVASFNTDLPAYARFYGLKVLEGPLWGYLRWIHRRAALNLCPSRPVQEQLQAQGIENVMLWRSGIDTRLFHPQRRSHIWRDRMTGGHTDERVILYVGRLAAEKGLDRLLAAITQLDGCHLALGGDGPLAEHLRSRANGLHVTFLGTLTGEELAAAYASADVFAQPSTTETFGFVTLEAMASGLPVVAARRGGSLDLVREGEYGRLFDPEEASTLVSALRSLLEQNQERERMGQAARQYVEGPQWSWKAATAELRRCYEQVVASAQESRHCGGNAPSSPPSARSIPSVPV